MQEKASPAMSLTRATLKTFFEFTKPQKFMVLGVVLLMLFAVGIDVARPWVTKEFIDALTANTPFSYDRALHLVGIIVGLIWLGQIVRRSRDWFNEKYQSQVKMTLQNYCFSILHRHSYGFSTKQFVGGLVKKAGRYDRAYEELSDQIIWGLGQTIAQILALGIGMFVLAQSFIPWFILWFIVFIVFVWLMLRWKQPKDTARVAADTKVTGHLADTLTNFLTVKLFAATPEEQRAMETVTLHAKQKLLTARWAGWLLASGQGILFSVLEMIFLYVSLHAWRDGSMSVGSIVAVQAYLGTLSGRLWDLGSQLRRINEALTDANEMTEIILLDPEITDVVGAKALKVPEGQLTFNTVSFRYSEKAPAVLSDFTLSVPPKQKVAFVGTSGGGKTTITKLLLRLHDIQNGSILIDDQNIRNITQLSLRRCISLVPQEPILFHRTLLENIRYGRQKSTPKEVVAAAKLAHAHEFISKFPEQYETLVGERGVKLSGGERQRVAIARAILKNAPILVLDEATSSLDSESEMLIQDALKNLMKNKTVIVIAHRLSTIMQMDRIVVLDGGKVIEDGKHDELLKAKQGIYQKLWEIQAGGFS